MNPGPLPDPWPEEESPRAPRAPYDRAILEPIIRDVGSPPVSCSREEVVELADRGWEFSDSEKYLVEWVVEQLQQDMHDLFIDTEWPRCPRHPNHPMWYSDGWWRCEKDGAIVPLGELSRLRGA